VPFTITHLQKEDFQDLFEEHKNLVFKTAYLMYGNRDDADEALQEVFILVYRSLSGYDPSKGAMTTWLHRITINYCLGHRRKQHITQEPLDGLQMASLDAPLELRMQAAADQLAIREAILALSEKLRAVIILRYYWDLPYNKIARILSIPLGTVKSRIDLALRTLGKIISESNISLVKDSSPDWEGVQ